MVDQSGPPNLWKYRPRNQRFLDSLTPTKNAAESKEINIDKIANHEYSGTVGVEPGKLKMKDLVKNYKGKRLLFAYCCNLN